LREQLAKKRAEKLGKSEAEREAKRLESVKVDIELKDLINRIKGTQS
jgi:hypothetical protein